MVKKINVSSALPGAAPAEAGEGDAPAMRRGRPRDPERMRKVLQAAQQEFLRGGFDGASVDAIARVSGVSKMTIYSYFPSKEALFEATVASRVDSAVSLGELGPLDPRNPQAALSRIGACFLTLIRSADVLAHHRMVFGATGQRSDSARSFYEGGTLRTTALVAAYLAEAHAAGSLAVPDPGLAEDQFLALFLGNAHIAGVLGLRTATAAEDQRLLTANVQLFLRGYGPAISGMVTP